MNKVMLRSAATFIIGAGAGMYLDEVKEKAGRPIGAWVIALGIGIYVIAR